MPHRRSMTTALLCAGMVAATVAGPAPLGAQEAAPPAERQTARTVLPPGNSMLYTVDGQAAGTASGDPDDFGANVDDQRELYWDYRFKDGRFVRGCDDPEVPRPGVEICWDDYGVPAVFADEAAGLWFGSGWVAAKLRLFLLDAVRRTARGTLSEIAGPGADGAGLAADVRTRYQTYSEDEYTAFYDGLSTEARTAVDGYVEGVNAWIAQVTGPAVDQLPAEYAVLSTQPEPLTREDVMAVGVLMTRFVASEGKREMQWVRALRALEAEFGTAEGRELFLDLVWQEDAAATTTVLAGEGTFPRTDQTDEQRRAAFDALADHAATLPHDLDVGPGADPEQQGPVPAGGGGDHGPLPDPLGAVDPGARAAAALQEWTAQLEGGSFQVSLGPSMTADGSTLLVSEPQLGYNPTLLMELQLSGAGYDARGVTVPGIPVVGIGYTPTVAWSLTTGNSKTVDSFVETMRPDSDGDGAPEYRHDGAWKNTDCRDETVSYREAPEGVPLGPAAQSETHTVCRTVHGPVVAPRIDEIDEQGELALSYQWHMAGREVDTIEGVLAWNRAETAQDILDSIPDLTWNENVGWADAAGDHGWWHPGLHREKAPGADLRLPLPGTGAYDNGGFLSVDELPHVVNPDRGWIANWNNKPAHGWLDSGGMSETSTPAGIDGRAATLHDAITARDDWTFEDLVELDRRVSSQDFRARHLLPMLLELRGRDDLTALEAEALDLLAGWDGSANGPGADMEFAGFDAGDEATSVGAAPTIFDTFATALVEDLLGFMRTPTYERDGQQFTFDLVERQSRMGRHVYDVSPALHLALRVLDPSLSSLDPARDYARGRSAEEVLRDVLAATVDQLSAAQGDDPATWRMAYTNPSDEVCSPTGVVGPCGIMPFLERGTWIHHVGWTPPAPPADDGTAPGDGAPAGDDGEPGDDDSGATLPATGGGLALVGLLAAALATAARRP